MSSCLTTLSWIRTSASSSFLSMSAVYMSPYFFFVKMYTLTLLRLKTDKSNHRLFFEYFDPLVAYFVRCNLNALFPLKHFHCFLLYFYSYLFFFFLLHFCILFRWNHNSRFTSIIICDCIVRIDHLKIRWKWNEAKTSE